MGIKTANLALIRVGLVRIRVPLPGSQPYLVEAELEGNILGFLPLNETFWRHGLPQVSPDAESPMIFHVPAGTGPCRHPSQTDIPMDNTRVGPRGPPPGKPH